MDSQSAAAVVSVEVPTSRHMRALGRALAGLLRAGDLIILSGGLGAGKTTLTQGIGDGLGVRGPITSPTFVIARVHPPVPGAAGGTGPSGTAPPGEVSAALASPRPPLVHADAYRLGSSLELDDLDLDTDTAAAVTVVEWGEGLAEGLAADRLEISITPQPGNGGDDLADPLADLPRTVRISAVGARWEGIQLPLASPADRL
jgi:tRNA threonylcarbamoyladenosine biosynthesis protein TsaE